MNLNVLIVLKTEFSLHLVTVQINGIMLPINVKNVLINVIYVNHLNLTVPFVLITELTNQIVDVQPEPLMMV